MSIAQTFTLPKKTLPDQLYQTVYEIKKEPTVVFSVVYQLEEIWTYPLYSKEIPKMKILGQTKFKLRKINV